MRQITVIITSVAAIVFAVTRVDGTASFRNTEKRILDSIIGDGKYDSRIRPSGSILNDTGSNGKDGPCIVRVNLFVRSIARIDDVTMVRLVNFAQ